MVMQGVDGIILFPTHQSDRNLAEFAASYQTLVLVDYVYQHAGPSAVLVDLSRGARLAVEHLIGGGIGPFGFVRTHHVAQRGKRLRAYRETLTGHGLPRARSR